MLVYFTTMTKMDPPETNAATMQQVWTTRVGSPDVLQPRQTSVPTPRNDELRIKVASIGVNFADLLIRQGAYPNGPKLPAVIGYEVSGWVDALGERSTGFALGERVMAYTPFGGYSDFICVKGIYCNLLPDSMSMEEGCSFPVNFNTAFALLNEMARIREGETVLIYSAAGGVGVAACQIGKTLGARPIGIASKAKHPFLQEFGVTDLVDLETDDLEERIAEITSGKGVDVILDSYGGSYWLRNQRLLSPMGRLIVYGYSSTIEKPLGKSEFPSKPWEVGNPLVLMQSNSAVMGVDLAQLWKHSDRVGEWTKKNLSWYEEGKIRPIVDKKFLLEEAAKAHQYLHERKNQGKVVLTTRYFQTNSGIKYNQP